jgi:hypothetical protein
MPNPEFKDFESPHEASVDRLVEALDRAYHRPGLLMWRSFLQGMFTALGTFVGAILIAAAVGFAIRSLGGVDFFKPVINQFQDFITQSAIQSQLKAAKTFQQQQ